MDSVAVERRKDEIPVGRIAHDAVEIQDAVEWRLRADPLVYLVTNGGLGRIPSAFGARSPHVVGRGGCDAEDTPAPSLPALRGGGAPRASPPPPRGPPRILRSQAKSGIGA